MKVMGGWSIFEPASLINQRRGKPPVEFQLMSQVDHSNRRGREALLRSQGPDDLLDWQLTLLIRVLNLSVRNHVVVCVGKVLLHMITPELFYVLRLPAGRGT